MIAVVLAVFAVAVGVLGVLVVMGAHRYDDEEGDDL